MGFQKAIKLEWERQQEKEKEEKEKKEKATKDKEVSLENVKFVCVESVTTVHLHSSKII